MTLPNEEVIDRFFRAYAAHDMDALREVLAEDVRWYFPGRHPLGGVHTGVDDVVAFFDAMAMTMGGAGFRNVKLASGSSGEYLIECQHITSQHEGGVKLEQEMCALWKVRDGKIVEGRHFAADERALEEFFNGAMGKAR